MKINIENQRPKPCDTQKKFKKYEILIKECNNLIRELALLQENLINDYAFNNSLASNWLLLLRKKFKIIEYKLEEICNKGGITYANYKKA